MWRYLIPNSITSASLVLGLASIWTAFSGDLDLAAWLVLWGVLLDTLDGAAARLLKASSALGAQLDSFADFVVFGLAPAALVAAGAGGHLAAAVFSVATATRLARYNTTPPDPAAFIGVPTTTCGATAALCWLIFQPASALAMSLLLLGLSVLMHAPIRIARLKPVRGQPVRNALMGVCVLMAYTLAPLRLYPEALLGMVVVAILGGAIWAPRPPP